MHASSSASAYLAPIMPAANLPTPPPFEYGPSVFEARRGAWLAQPAPSAAASSSNSGAQAGSSPKRPGASAGADASFKRLEELLALCDGDETPRELWKAGLENVHRGLIGGRRLARPMPLSLTIKILRAGWLRDGTWPKGLPPVADSPPFVTHPLLGDPGGDPLAGAASDEVSVLLASPQVEALMDEPLPSRPERLAAAQGGAEGLAEEGSGSISDTEGAGPAELQQEAI